MRIIILLFFSMIVANVLPASAQTEFVKYKKYLIPINVGVDTTSPECVGMSATQKNVIYIDDVGEHPQDLNGLLDLPVVLGLSEHVNILAIGVGVPGKRRGLNYSDVVQRDIDVTKDIVNASRLTRKPPVYSKTILRDKIIDFAGCSTNNNKLILAVGGPWNDVDKALSYMPSIADKIRVIGITGSNTDTSTLHDDPNSSVSSNQAYENIKAKVSTEEISPKNYVAGLTSDSSGDYDDDGLNSFFTDNLNAFYNLLPSSSNIQLTASVSGVRLNDSRFKTELKLQNNARGWGAHPMRIADFGTVARAVNLGTLSEIYTKSFMYPKISDAIDYARTGE